MISLTIIQWHHSEVIVLRLYNFILICSDLLGPLASQPTRCYWTVVDNHWYSSYWWHCAANWLSPHGSIWGVPGFLEMRAPNSSKTDLLWLGNQRFGPPWNSETSMLKSCCILFHTMFYPDLNPSSLITAAHLRQQVLPPCQTAGFLAQGSWKWKWDSGTWVLWPRHRDGRGPVARSGGSCALWISMVSSQKLRKTLRIR